MLGDLAWEQDLSDQECVDWSCFYAGCRWEQQQFEAMRLMRSGRMENTGGARGAFTATGESRQSRDCDSLMLNSNVVQSSWLTTNSCSYKQTCKKQICLCTFKIAEWLITRNDSVCIWSLMETYCQNKTDWIMPGWFGMQAALSKHIHSSNPL